jgi:hypothetical protein
VAIAAEHPHIPQLEPVDSLHSPEPSLRKQHSLQPNRQHAWHTGVAADGTQYFLGLDSDAAVCLRFSPEGHFLDAETRPFLQAGIPPVDLDHLPAREGHSIPATIASANPRGCEAVAHWAAELIARKGAVHVLEFEFPERHIALRSMPAIYEEFLESPWAYDEEERFALAVKIRRWRDLERFVVQWHGEHWCASDGLIHS